MEYHTIRIKTVHTTEEGVDQGFLSVFEAERNIPFPIRRVYYIHGAGAGVHRGGHAHKKLKQILFCPYGAIEILLDDGRERERVLLDRPDLGLIVEHNMWREMTWLKEDSVLMVAASEYYDESDYIRDYQTFLAAVADGADR